MLDVNENTDKYELVFLRLSDLPRVLVTLLTCH